MIVLGILQRITQKVLWNCSKLFIRVCFCSNNKPISGVTAKAGFYSLFPSASVWLGWLGLFCFTMRMSSPGFECLPLAVTVIFFTSDFRRRGVGGCGSPNRWSLPIRAGLRGRGGGGCEMPFVSFSSYLEQKGSSLFICWLVSFAH